MVITKQKQIESTLKLLFNDAKNDRIKVMRSIAKRIFRPIQPSDFKDAYLSISKEQGTFLTQLIIDNNIKNIVEFGTSFGISTLFLAQGIIKTKGKIVTTELIEDKAKKAISNFKKAGVNDLIEVRIGDALDTLQNYSTPIDLLLLDGWKDLYLPLFQMLETNFHRNTFIYVDNADMNETRKFLEVVKQNSKYNLQSMNNNKVVLITLK